MNQKAILVVSFGTSFNDTREKTIDVIEKKLADAFADRTFYRAWTSKMIMKKVEKRDGVKINTVTEAMEQMRADGIKDVIVQPTHVMNGFENNLMKKEILAYAGEFDQILFGGPLLDKEEDKLEVIEALRKEFALGSEDALVLMGHGSEHYANSIYAELDYTFKDLGYDNMHIGTVEAYPTVESVLRLVKKQEPKKVYMAPFMIVAGDHANNDLAGEEADSWKSLFQNEGHEVECVLKGLGEYAAVQELFVKHAQNAAPSEFVEL